MIGWLQGRLLEATEETALIDVSGVGYELQCSSSTLSDISASAHLVRLYVHTHVREDALVLFGFSTKPERELFHSLLKVNGVGPKMAMKVLSAGSVEYITQTIEAGDAVALAKLPKVGKKTAEQVVLTLRGKLPTEDAFAADGSKKSGTTQPPSRLARFSGARADVLSALVHLGFRPADVENWLQTANESISLEDGVRQGLRALTNI
jgi:holliday junction DNA helicase RuvA